jgi:hypothetical protein
MAGVDQKERYRHQAALCYEIAATMTGTQATSMMRLGDAYAALSLAPSPSIVPSATIEEFDEPQYRGDLGEVLPRERPLCRQTARRQHITAGKARRLFAGANRSGA